MYRVRKMHHPALSGRSPDELPVSTYLYSLFGLGLRSLQGRMPVNDRALLFYAGILSQTKRSASGLATILADYFRVPADIGQLVGGWRHLDREHWTMLGVSGQNCVLGENSVAGTRVWEQHGRFEIRLGPMSYRQFENFLPNGSAYAPLCGIARFYASREFDFTVRLALLAAEVPGCHLGKTSLGWNSWLKSRPFIKDDSQVVLTAASIEAEE